MNPNVPYFNTTNLESIESIAGPPPRGSGVAR